MPAESSYSSDFQIGVFEKEFPGTYFVPVMVLVRGPNGIYKVTQEILKVFVVPRGDLRRIKIIEYPPVIEMRPFSEVEVSFLANNIGDHDLTDIVIDYDETECLSGISGSNDITEGEIKSLFYTFESAGPGACDYNIKFMEGDQLVGFVPVTLIVRQRSVFEESPLKATILLLTLAGWTAITVYALTRKRKQKKDESEESDSILE